MTSSLCVSGVPNKDFQGHVSTVLKHSSSFTIIMGRDCFNYAIECDGLKSNCSPSAIAHFETLDEAVENRDKYLQNLRDNGVNVTLGQCLSINSGWIVQFVKIKDVVEKTKRNTIDWLCDVGTGVIIGIFVSFALSPTFKSFGQ